MKLVQKKNIRHEDPHSIRKPISTREFPSEMSNPLANTSQGSELPDAMSRPPSWLRRLDIKDPLYRRIRKALIHDIAPQDTIEWIWAYDVVLAQYQIIRFGGWHGALLRIADVMHKGAKRAAKSRLPAGMDSEELDERAGQMGARMQHNMVYRNEIEAESYLSRRVDLDSIHRRLVSTRRRRDTALRQIEQRRISIAKQVAQGSVVRRGAIFEANERRRTSVVEALNGEPEQDLPLTELRNGH
jgi:hypothetical protein